MGSVGNSLRSACVPVRSHGLLTGRQIIGPVTSLRWTVPLVAVIASLLLTGCAARRHTGFRTLPNADPPLAVWGPRPGPQYKGTSFGSYGWPAEVRPCQEVWTYESRLSATEQQRMWEYYTDELTARSWKIETKEANWLTASKERFWLWMSYSQADPRITLTITPCEYRWY